MDKEGLQAVIDGFGDNHDATSQLQSMSYGFSKDLLTRGALIGEVDIVDCVTDSDSPWFTGKYGFVLANPELYSRPKYYRGELGLFEVHL
jgi:hypothetical protein